MVGYSTIAHLPEPMAKRQHGSVKTVQLDSDLPPEFGAVIEPLACSIHAVQRGKIELGDVVVVSGCGTLGLGMVGADGGTSSAVAYCRIVFDIRSSSSLPRN